MDISQLAASILGLKQGQEARLPTSVDQVLTPEVTDLGQSIVQGLTGQYERNLDDAKRAQAANFVAGAQMLGGGSYGSLTGALSRGFTAGAKTYHTLEAEELKRQMQRVEQFLKAQQLNAKLAHDRAMEDAARRRASAAERRALASEKKNVEKTDQIKWRGPMPDGTLWGVAPDGKPVIAMAGGRARYMGGEEYQQLQDQLQQPTQTPAYSATPPPAQQPSMPATPRAVEEAKIAKAPGAELYDYEGNATWAPGPPAQATPSLAQAPTTQYPEVAPDGTVKFPPKPAAPHMELVPKPGEPGKKVLMELKPGDVVPDYTVRDKNLARAIQVARPTLAKVAKYMREKPAPSHPHQLVNWAYYNAPAPIVQQVMDSLNLPIDREYQDFMGDVNVVYFVMSQANSSGRLGIGLVDFFGKHLPNPQKDSYAQLQNKMRVIGTMETNISKTLNLLEAKPGEVITAKNVGLMLTDRGDNVRLAFAKPGEKKQAMDGMDIVRYLVDEVGYDYDTAYEKVFNEARKLKLTSGSSEE